MLATVSLGNRHVTVSSGQSVLDALIEAGIKVPNSCRAGICQSCVTQAISGEPPLAAQVGLKETLKRQNYFLACSCYPKQDLVIAEFDSTRYSAQVKKLVRRSPNVLEIHLQPDSDLLYQAGQFLTLWCNLPGMEDEGRCYSLASVPTLDETLIIQVAKVNGGCVSSWAHEQLSQGQQVYIQKPTGNCFFAPEDPDQPILLAGTGTGLAPLYGILRDALHKRHRGEIHLFHRGYSSEELYLHRELQQLAGSHEKFHYHPSVWSGCSDDTITEQTLEKMIGEEFPELKNWQVYLCGNPEMVKALRKQTFLAGVSMQQIFSDAFVSSRSEQGLEVEASVTG